MLIPNPYALALPGSPHADLAPERREVLSARRRAHVTCCAASTLDIKEGEFVSIMGPSGAGKSTLLHILGMHDSAWTGEYYFMDQPVHRLDRQSSARSCTRSTSASSSRAITCSTT